MISSATENRTASGSRQSIVMRLSCRDYSFRGFTRAVVVDVQTTGIDPKCDRIVAIRCLRGSIEELATKGFTHLDAFKAHFDPEISILPEPTCGDGIRESHVAEKGTFAAIAAELREFIGPLPLIGYYVSYDKAFLADEFGRAGQRSLNQNKLYCIFKRLREHFGYSAGYISLAEACQRFGIDRRAGPHQDAAEDTVLALQLAAYLYQLDNDLPRTPIRAPELVAAARTPIAVWDRKTIVLAVVLSVLAAASSLLFL
jgi:DNA polymerase III epsilon subunit-like protein